MFFPSMIFWMVSIALRTSSGPLFILAFRILAFAFWLLHSWANLPSYWPVIPPECYLLVAFCFCALFAFLFWRFLLCILAHFFLAFAFCFPFAGHPCNFIGVRADFHESHSLTPVAVAC